MIVKQCKTRVFYIIMFVSEKCVLFSKKVRLFSQNDVLFLFYFWVNPTMTTVKLNDVNCAIRNCISSDTFVF